MPELPSWCQNLANSCSFVQPHDVKTWLEKPVASVCCRTVLPCLSKTVSHTCQSGRSLGSSCGAMQTSNTSGPRSLPKTGNRHTSKIGPTGSTRAQESCETGEIVANGVSSGGLMQTKRSVTVDRVVDLCSPQHSVLSFVLCFCSPMSLKMLISWSCRC